MAMAENVSFVCYYRRSAFVIFKWIVVLIVILGFIWLLLRKGEVVFSNRFISYPVGDTLNVPAATRREFSYTINVLRSAMDLGEKQNGDGTDDADFVVAPASDAHQDAPPSRNMTRIALGTSITSRELPEPGPETVGKLVFFTTLLPSFCQTASKNFSYHFYLAYDNDDILFTNNESLSSFRHLFTEFCVHNCPKQSRYSVHFVRCAHTGRPAWAQNDAMFDAYLDGADFFYRVNDDSRLVTAGWTESFITQLGRFRPPNVGVVGPKHHGGNGDIITHDFTHRSHVHVFGYYYPRLFTDWWADGWITRVYQPARSVKLPGVLLTHTMKYGRRYELVDVGVGRQLNAQILYDRITLKRYLRHRAQREAGDVPAGGGSRIISMCLWGANPRYTRGAIRNAQLAPLVYPRWRLRIYIPGTTAHAHLHIPARVLRTLTSLGAELVTVSSPSSGDVIEPRYWRYLVADDESVSEFVVRNCDARLGEREAAAVDDWMASSEIIHVIRDHPKHVTSAIPEGLWGARRTGMLAALGQSMSSALLKRGEVLNTVIWRALNSSMLCHDGVSCTTDTSCRPFPELEREDVIWKGPEYVGMTFTQHMEPDGEKLDSVHLIGDGPMFGAK